jgi:hypothetical protein
LFTIFVDFIFVDFDKILDKLFIYSAFFWGIIFCRPCLPGTVVDHLVDASLGTLEYDHTLLSIWKVLSPLFILTAVAK